MMKTRNIGRLRIESLPNRPPICEGLQREYTSSNLKIEDYDRLKQEAAPLVTGKIYRLWIKPLRWLITYDATRVLKRLDIEDLYKQPADFDVHFIPAKRKDTETESTVIVY